MLVQHSGNILREIQFDESLAEVGKNPQIWQFKEFYDAATLGVEFIWNYDTYKNRDECPVIREQLSSELFSLTFDENIRVKESCSLLLFPHYSAYLPRNKNIPNPIVQCIEFDWYPGKLKIIFVERNFIFKKGKPFAQGIVVPRKEYTVKKLSRNETNDIKASEEFMKKNADKYTTRRVVNEGYAEQNNLYGRLSQLNKNGVLPEEIKVHNKNLRIIWR